MDLIVKAWKPVEWDNLQIRIEEEIKAIGERQEDGEVGRKSLVEESNKYRKNTDKESRKLAVPLLKAFQKEVDRLTAVSKATEASLIEVCSRLTNLPDPLPILEQAPTWKGQAEKTNFAIEEANQLRSTVNELHSEFADLKNQDVTIRQFRDRIKQLESEKTTEVDQAVTDTERRLLEEQAASQFETNMRSDKLKAENQSLGKKVADLEQRMKEAQRRQDMSRQAADQRDTFQLEQIEILTRDLESANRRVSTLEGDVSRLTTELAEALEKSKRGGLEDIAAFGGLMKEKDEQMARLKEENKQLINKMEHEAKRTTAVQSEMAREMEKQRLALREFEARLADMSDYEAIKKELRLLREIEFGEAADANEEAINKLGETVQSLDRLLAEKNRRLQNDNAQLRQTNHRLQGDEIMRAIRAGGQGHQLVVDTVSKSVGMEIAERYMDPEVDFSLDRKISRSLRAASRDRSEKQLASTSVPHNSAHVPAPVTHPTEDDSQNLFKILMNMGKNKASSPSVGSITPVRTRERSPADIPFEQFRYSPKLTNYTGEPAKTPQEIKAIQELQGCVAGNIRNLGSKALNTAEIAKQCKRLMVAYNIGQRLFAKYVMNQSQGSLSELLSKPRHWNKLTDKGREAFRRIYGWLSDDKAIGLLVSLSPRRVWPADQKVDHPRPESMWESNSGKLPSEDPEEVRRRGAVSAREDQYRLAGTSQAANSGATQRNSRWRHDDIPKEKIISIFNTEMAKLREQESNLERAIASRSFGTPHIRRTDELNSSYQEMTHTERMASINQAHLVMQKRMNSGLHPITQEQFELFGHIDTEDVVRQIKEFLSMNSISQRQFGEHVLGLSQGSVSDLLARPKQWNMLTQKGREPFIRMKLFMREIAQATEKARKEKENGDRRRDSKGLPSFSHTITTMPLFSNVKLEEEDDDYPLEILEDPNSDQDIPEPDTTILIRKVKDRLHLHGISQRLFGEQVLGISAGGCSELFLRPRPWSTLNGRNKEPYEKIIAWLQDKDGISRLLVKERESGHLADFNENGKRLSDPPYDPPPRKVQRTVITDQQKEALRFVFQHEQHPSQKTIELLAIKLNLNIRTVNNWFHNHRTRQKASMKEGKVYSPALGSMPRSVNWQEDLAVMLDNVSQTCMFDGTLPTMVAFPNLSFDDPTEDEEEDEEAPSQLDKAVERMRQLAAAKCT